MTNVSEPDEYGDSNGTAYHINNCQCYSCRDYSYRDNPYDLSFFRQPILDHYTQLNDSVFEPLRKLAVQIDDSTYPFTLLFNLPHSAFYHDAERHMSGDMKQTISRIQTSIQAYNKYTKDNSSVVDKILVSKIPSSGPVGTPIFSDSSTRSVRQMIRTMLDSITSTNTENIVNVIQQYNLKSQKGYTFNTAETPIADSIFDELERNSDFHEYVRTLRELRKPVIQQIETLNKHGEEISKSIKDKRYRVKRRCCPNLWTELWHLLGISLR